LLSNFIGPNIPFFIANIVLPLCQSNTENQDYQALLKINPFSSGIIPEDLTLEKSKYSVKKILFEQTDTLT